MKILRLIKQLFGHKIEELKEDLMKKYLIVGLGNIGAKYDETRHNIGFKILDELASSEEISFESEKLGKNKQSMAMNFVFQDEDKTLKDEEVDKWMKKISNTIESTLAAEIRK